MKSRTSKHEFWKDLSKTKLTDTEIELFCEQLDWAIVSKEGKLTERQWVHFNEKIHGSEFALNPFVAPSTFRLLRDRVNWTKMEHWRGIDDEFLLSIGDNFHTVTFINDNPSSDTINEETWQALMERYGKQMNEMDQHHQKNFIREQIVSMDSLSRYHEKWNENDWQTISRFQRLTLDFIKQHWERLHTKIIRTTNVAHNLTNEELKEIREYVSEQVNEQIEKGYEPDDWDKLNTKHALTAAFFEKHKHHFEIKFK